MRLPMTAERDEVVNYRGQKFLVAQRESRRDDEGNKVRPDRLRIEREVGPGEWISYVVWEDQLDRLGPDECRYEHQTWEIVERDDDGWFTLQRTDPASGEIIVKHAPMEEISKVHEGANEAELTELAMIDLLQKGGYLYRPGKGWWVSDSLDPSSSWHEDKENAATRSRITTVVNEFRPNATVSSIRNVIDRLEPSGHFIRPDDQWDTDPYLICVRNGVVDLRTGELLPGDRDLLMTRVAPVAYTEPLPLRTARPPTCGTSATPLPVRRTSRHGGSRRVRPSGATTARPSPRCSCT